MTVAIVRKCCVGAQQHVIAPSDSGHSVFILHNINSHLFVLCMKIKMNVICGAISWRFWLAFVLYAW